MIKIGRIEINKNKAPLIIPEMGINHNGNFEIAVKIIRTAKKAGAKIIKNQTHIPEDEYSEEAKDYNDYTTIRAVWHIGFCSWADERRYSRYAQQCRGRDNSLYNENRSGSLRARSS